MRRSPTALLVAALPVLLGARAAWAQTTSAVCAPTVELGGSIPPRVAQRLRRALDHAVGTLPPAAPCAPTHARLDWNEHELTVHISLDDGRIAVRTLESLEDVLPTVLSVLAVPAPDPTAPAVEPPPAAPSPPAVAPAPVVAIAPPTIPAPRVAPTRPRAPSGWSLLLSGAAGVAFHDGDGALGRSSVEVGAATPRFAIAARGSLALSLGDHHRRGLPNAIYPRPENNRIESSAVLSARARLGSGTLRAEVGGFGGVSHDAAGTDSGWLPRVGIEASLGWQLSRSLSAFARTEGYLDLGSGLGPGVALSVGLSWERRR
jgi:hypothetical protein